MCSFAEGSSDGQSHLLKISHPVTTLPFSPHKSLRLGLFGALHFLNLESKQLQASTLQGKVSSRRFSKSLQELGGGSMVTLVLTFVLL